MILYRSGESHESVAVHGRGGIQPENSNCSDPLKSAHSMFMEPIGFAIAIETLLTFSLLVWLFTKVEVHEKETSIEYMFSARVIKHAKQHLFMEHLKILENYRGLVQEDSLRSRLKLFLHLASSRFRTFSIM